MKADNTFFRFDRFDKKYNPFGHRTLRSVFLKYDNFIKGRFFAELTREVIDNLEQNKYEFVEWRISINGQSPNSLTQVYSCIEFKFCRKKQIRLEYTRKLDL